MDALRTEWTLTRRAKSTARLSGPAMLKGARTAVESAYGCGSLWTQSATQECHTEKHNKINISQDWDLSSTLTGSCRSSPLVLSRAKAAAGRFSSNVLRRFGRSWVGSGRTAIRAVRSGMLLSRCFSHEIEYRAESASFDRRPSPRANY